MDLRSLFRWTGGRALSQGDPTTSRNADDLLNAQIRMVYKTANPGLMHSLLVAVVGWTYWGVAPQAGLIAWLALAFGLSAARTILVWWFEYSQPEDRDLLIWDRIYLFAVFATGLTWGVSGILLYPSDNYLYQVMLGFVVGGISASATASLSPRMPAVLIAVTPALGLLALRFAFDPTGGHIEMAVLLFLYLLVLMNIGRSMNKQVVEALSLRFENQDLVRSLEKTVQQLDVARSEAENSSRAKTRFLAAASHDLRQPVHALRLFTAALARKRERDPAERETISKIDRSLDVIGNLLNSLLDVSKLDANIVEVHNERIALRSFLSQIVNEFELEAEGKGLSLRLWVQDIEIDSDPVLLGQIVRNLLSNAIKYTETGGVLLALRRRSSFVQIEVWDTGIGIADGHVEDVFQEFFQVDNDARQQQSGLGLGLSIVKRTCDLLGYELAVCSRPQQGSRFALTIPSGGKPAIRPVRSNIVSDEADMTGLRVLLVEDDAHSKEAMELLFAAWGIVPVHASSVGEVESVITKLNHQLDLIVTDYRLPGGETGRDAIERARALCGSELPAIIVTGDTAPERLREIGETGAQLLHKPVQPARLRAVLRHLVAMPD